MKKSAALLSALAIVLMPALTACGGSKTTTLHVFAAASLKESFTTLGQQFEKDHPHVKVDFSFGASDVLASQVDQGAPADVFATASTKTMDLVASKVTGRKNFATNTMEIAVPAKNPGHITKLADLTRKGVKLAVCQAEVPCGTVAATVFANAKLKVHPVTEEVDVKSVLTKVSLGEVDAGIVYVSDVKTAGDSVKGITIPNAVNAVTTYPISVVKDSDHTDLAKEFEALVTGAAGQKVLAANGFAGPA
ncbi:MAG TPA: molybdate ABC transporter substrate-binding protein [Marmoricola sp.]